MKIYPAGMEATSESNPLKIDDKKRTEMVAKAKELLGDKPMESGELKNKLEAFYVKTNDHYTSKQLKDIVDQVATDLTPEPKEIEELI